MHAPCLLITQRVWGTDPWGKLERSAEMASALDADVVVVHPPFRWQRDYAAGFVEGIAELERVRHRLRGGEHVPVAGHLASARSRSTSPAGTRREESYANTTIDLSHAPPRSPTRSRWPSAGRSAAAHAHDRRQRLGQGRAPRPGPAASRCGRFLEHLADRGFAGHIVVEINTRKAGDPEEREADLLEALAFSGCTSRPPAPDRLGESAVGRVRRMLTRLGCAVTTLLLALGLAACGSDEPSPTSAPPSASPTAPPGLDNKAPTPPDEVADTEQSAEEFSRYFAQVVQHAIRVRDSTPVAELARDQATCDSCRGLSTYIEGLKKDKLWELADDLVISRLRVRSTGDSTYGVSGPAVYPRISFVDVTAEQQAKQDVSRYRFEVDLVWDADRERWQVEDYSLINQGRKTS